MDYANKLKLKDSERFREQFPKYHISSKVANSFVIEDCKIRPSMFSSMMSPNEHTKNPVVKIKIQSPERQINITALNRNSCIDAIRSNSPNFDLEDVPKINFQIIEPKSNRYSKKSITRQEFNQIKLDERTRNISIPKDFTNVNKLFPDLDKGIFAKRLQTGTRKLRNTTLEAKNMTELITVIPFAIFPLCHVPTIK